MRTTKLAISRRILLTRNFVTTGKRPLLTWRRSATSWIFHKEAGPKLSIFQVDVSSSFTRIFAVKDEGELETCRSSAIATVNAWSYARKKFIEAIDQEKVRSWDRRIRYWQAWPSHFQKVKHSRLANEIDAEIGSMKVQGQLAKNKTIETCYNPIIMSGGNYSLKWSTERLARRFTHLGSSYQMRSCSSDKLLHYGVIVTSLGARLEVTISTLLFCGLLRSNFTNNHKSVPRFRTIARIWRGRSW